MYIWKHEMSIYCTSCGPVATPDANNCCTLGLPLTLIIEIWTYRSNEKLKPYFFSIFPNNPGQISIF